MLRIPVEQLADVDIAEMNLLCATGLPGADKLDIDRALATLDAWAEHVRVETERHLYRFRQAPQEYEHSEGYFRMLMLVTVLQQDFGVRYNKERIRDVDFRRSQDLFIHGMMGSDNGGTCVSMPVIYSAVARRLGYPVRLVHTKGHVFCRWDARGERFNIEATNRGMNSFSDEYYLTWPEKVGEAEARHNRYLVSLTPAEELAGFLAARGHCGLDNGQITFAARCYENAYRYDTTRPAYQAWFLDAAMQSGYRPATPALAQMLAERINRVAAVRRGGFDPMDMPRPGDMAAMGEVSCQPHVRVGQSRQKIPQPHLPRAPQPGLVQPSRPLVPELPREPQQ